VEDIYEANSIEEYKDSISPMDWADKQFNEIYHRNWKMYLDSIEWDTWCKHETEEERKARIKKHELETHPFRNFF